MPHPRQRNRPKSRPKATARSVALALTDSIFKGASLDDALADNRDWHALDSRDRAFSRLLVSATLRRLGQIDALIDGALDKPLARRADLARHVLRIGIAQLMFLDVPAHAAIGETVEMAKGGALAPYQKLINAVLRRIQREGAAMVAEQDAARLNTPAWLWNSWQAAYGEAVCRAIAEAHLETPPLDLTVKADPAAWAERLGATVLPTGSLRIRPSGPVSDLDGYGDGAWWVQDAAAALPARLLGDVAGKSVIDLCAAPGGKTAQLAAAGARVVAVDRSQTRLTRVGENMARLHLAAETVAAEATTWRPQAPADAVLLDAPCSATGTLRRHPDIAWTKSAADVTSLAATQDRLLQSAIEMVKPGGLLVYCTCSMQPDEGPARIAALLAGGAPLERVPVRTDEIGGLDALTMDGDLRTLPCHLADQGGMDGFYACRLRRL